MSSNKHNEPTISRNAAPQTTALTAANLAMHNLIHSSQGPGYVSKPEPCLFIIHTDGIWKAVTDTYDAFLARKPRGSLALRILVDAEVCCEESRVKGCLHDCLGVYVGKVLLDARVDPLALARMYRRVHDNDVNRVVALLIVQMLFV